MIFVLAEEQVPRSDAVVGLALHARSARSADRWLEEKLLEAREHPERALKWLEEVLVRGLGEASGTHGAEHTKRTGRSAGGGTLTKGS